MAPKADKGKVVKSTEVQRLAALRKERAVFPPKLAVKELRENYYLFWSTKTRAHPRTKVLPSAASELAPNGYPFFALFFKGVATALQRLREKIPKQLADESRKICAGALQKVLVKVAFRNPGLNLTNVLRTLPPDADLEALKTLVAPIVDKVSGIKRVEGDRVD